MTRSPAAASEDLSAVPAARGTVYQAFGRTVTRFPDRDFLSILPETARHYGIDARSYSYREAQQVVELLRDRYAAAGLGPGQRAGLLLENRPAMFFHWLALNALGVSVVPINPEWRSAELEYLLDHSQLSVAVAPAASQADLSGAAAKTGRAVRVTTPDLQNLTQHPVASLTPVDVDESTECALLYTSGTTGRPKGCSLSNEYFLWAGLWYGQMGGLGSLVPGAERLLTPLPMSHMNALAFSTMAMLLSGGCVVPLDRFHPATWWDSVRLSRATIVHYLGVMPAMLWGAEATDRDRDHTVRFGFGAGVSPRLHQPFEGRFGFPLLEAWAMTETGAGAVIIANHEPRKVGRACFGRAPAFLDFRVVTEEGRDAAIDEPGELWVRSRTGRPRFGFFGGYLHDGQATAEAWAEGYFHTGDIVFVDADADFHFVDRRKNVIRRSGENISAVEVESVLMQHPLIANVGVTAVPDDLRGDEVMACVVARQGIACEEQAAMARNVQEFCLRRLAYFKAPGYVAFCDRLPLTVTEKIQRAGLKELAHRLLGTSATVDLRAQKKRSEPA